MKLSSIKEHLRLLTASRPLPLEKPKAVQFPVIDICNSRCQMCRIWENKQSVDISVDELRKGLSDGLFSEVESIGFNGGEPTLRKDLSDLVQVVVESLPRLRGVSLITNAFKYRQVIEQIEAMGNIFKPRHIAFDVMVSLDGYGDVHDRVRGRPGNFENAQHVINFIKSSPLVDSVRIGCTVIRENVNDLPDLLDFCIRNDLYIKYRQGVPHQRLYTENLKDPYALTFEEKYEFAEFLEGLIEHYEPGLMQRFFYRSLIDQIIKASPRRAGCAWQHKGATITARGELAYCAVQSKVLSPNIAEGRPSDAYFGNQEHLNEIIQNECDQCHHDYVGAPGRADYRKLFLQMLDQRFNIKSKVKSLPGFRRFNGLRSKRRFQLDLNRHRELPQQIRLADAGESESGGSKRVLICGWYGTETLGDKAIIAGVMTAMRKHLGQGTKFTVASLNPYVTEMTKKQMGEFENVEIVDIDHAVATSATMDYLVFGGGPMMAIDPLAPMEVMFERAHAAGVTTIAASVGVGPLGGAWLNQSIRRILELCDIRIYRDEKSRQNAVQLGVPAENDDVAEDPAFTWLRGVPERKTNPSDDHHKTLLLGLRDFPYREYAAGLSERESLALKQNYEQTVVEAIRELMAQNKDLIVRPLPMCTNHFGGDDRWFYRRLFRDLAATGARLDYSLLGPEQSPLHYVKAFQDADALLGMRFHSLVFGIGLGVNCVAIDYTMGRGKVRSLAEKHEVPMLNMPELEPRRLFEVLSEALDAPPPPLFDAAALQFEEILGSALQISQEKNPESMGAVV
ncbi:polysaccharide pyruvyl transferase family protein [Marinobacter shengliensis]